MKKSIFIVVLSAIIFFFVGFMELDNEFYESPGFIIKWPPTTQWEFPSTGMNDPVNQDQEKMNKEYYKRLATHRKLGDFGDMLAFGLVELLAISIFIKPVFPKQRRWRDVLLISGAMFVSMLCYAFWARWWWWTRSPSVILLGISLATHWILLRLLRPVKKY